MFHDTVTRDLERERLLAVNGRVTFVTTFVAAPLVGANLAYQVFLLPVWQFKALLAATGALFLVWAAGFVANRHGHLTLSVGLTVFASLTFDALAITLRQDTFFAATLATGGMAIYCWAFAPRLVPYGAGFTVCWCVALRLLESMGKLPAARPSPHIGFILDVTVIGTTMPVIFYFLHWRSRISEFPYQALSRQQQWLEAVIHELPIPLVIADSSSGEVVFSSTEGERLLAAGAFSAATDDGDGEQGRCKSVSLASLVRRVAAGESCEAEETTWRLANGDRATAICFARQLPKLFGHDATVLVALLDVTGLKKAQAELRAALTAKEDFLSVASHELRTPLTALALQLDNMTRTAALHPERMDAEWLTVRVGTLQRQARRLTMLVNGLLDLSRIEAGRIVLAREPLELGELVAEVASRFQHEAASAGCQIRVEVSAPTCGVWDRQCLDQVLTNLVSNAIKYGAGKPVDISFGARGGVARITVADHGIGIAPEEVTKIFQRFERLHTSREHPGFGLGLWIARSLVEKMGGTIEVETAVGAGSRFSVLLPAHLAERGVSEPVAALG